MHKTEGYENCSYLDQVDSRTKNWCSDYQVRFAVDIGVDTDCLPILGFAAVPSEAVAHTDC